ncbi:MAG TPA: glycosyltransferase family 1 protein [Alphaproteobacteria bacterium]|nr:glycosyltransferase family 1 protein [Alphaproteobacteria bacterium]
MRIGFDVSQTGADKAGCGFLADNLIRHLPRLLPDDEFLLYPTFGDVFWDPSGLQDTALPGGANVRRGFHHADFEAARDFWRSPPADLDRLLGDPDIVHSNNFFCPSRLRRARLVYTLYDLNFLENPEWTTEANRIGCFQGVFGASVNADFIIAISDFSRRHFLSCFPHYPVERTAVVHLASRFDDASADAPAAEAPERLAHLRAAGFWLTVGTIEPRKNYDGLLEAYARLKAHDGAVAPLVIAGKSGWMMQHFEERLAELGLAHDVLRLGYVSETELRWLYRNCFAFVYPSFWEGFGLPVVEAMSQGAPVISSNVSSIPEILDDAGLLIDPHDGEALLRAMRHLAGSSARRRELSERAREHAARFSWQAAARRVAQIYREALGRPRYAESPA